MVDEWIPHDRWYEVHKEWQFENRLTATPTVLINGYQLPDSYKIEDMRHFGDLNINWYINVTVEYRRAVTVME